jgi:polar amino acid transport system substrate-binding protein
MKPLETTRNIAIAMALILVSALASAETISLVSGEEYPPFTGSSLTSGGVLTELVQLAFAAAGHRITLDFKPWARGYEETLGLEYEGTYPYLSTARRKADFLFSDPLYNLSLRFYVQQSSRWQSGSPQELRNAIFCLPLGYEVSGWVRRQSEQLNFVRPRSMQQCYAMLELGRVDVLISNPDEVAWQAMAPQLTAHNVRQLPEPLGDVTLHLIFPRAHPSAQKTLHEFNKGLRHIISTGVRDRLFNEHPAYPYGVQTKN